MKKTRDVIVTLFFCFCSVAIFAQTSVPQISTVSRSEQIATSNTQLSSETPLFLPGEVASYQIFIPPDPLTTTVRILSSLIFVLLLCLAISYFLQKRFGYQQSVFGRVLGILPLDNRKFLYLVEIMGKIFVLGVTDQSINLICEINDKTTVDALLMQKSSPSSSVLEKLFPFLRAKGQSDHVLTQDQISERTKFAQEQVQRLEQLMLQHQRPSPGKSPINNNRTNLFK